MKYKTIKWVLRKQIKFERNCVWAWLDNEFICVFKHIPKEATELYSPTQLLNKLESL